MMAHELFEKLGYLRELDDDYIVYVERGNPWNYFKFVNKCVMFPSQNGLSYSTISPRFAKAIYMQMKELGWIEEEKPQETNLDHYKYDIVERFMDDLAMADKKIRTCQITSCSDCEFSKENGECIGKSKIKKWFDQPYKKPTYKLTQCEYDMLDTVFEKEARFSTVYLIGELKKKGYFENIKCDRNVLVKDILANCEVIQ